MKLKFKNQAFQTAYFCKVKMIYIDPPYNTGNRPCFTDAGSPALAEELYEYFIKACDGKFNKVAHGVFGADMKVELINDGPFTVILES
jgi:D-tyrosyl-tRNA(Tyr) deacylase